MYVEGKRFISPQYTKEDYLALNLMLNSSDDTWEQAICIFEDRIRGRFIDQIKLMSNDLNGNGFSIMAINCLLVETLLHFRSGKARTTGYDYQRFLIFLFGSDIDPTIAERFYHGVRCGILHSAETGKDIALSFQDEKVFLERDGYLYISLDRFFDRLEGYFDHYLWELRCGNSTNLRKKFIKRMKSLCNKDV